jgi:hypothetical protein
MTELLEFRNKTFITVTEGSTVETTWGKKNHKMYRGVVKYKHGDYCKVHWEHGGFGWIHEKYLMGTLKAEQHRFLADFSHKYDHFLSTFVLLRKAKKDMNMTIDTSHKDKWIQTFKDIEGQCSKPLPIWDHHAIKWRATLKPSEITSFVKIAKEHQKRYPKRWYHKIGHFLSFTKSTQ